MSQVLTRCPACRQLDFDPREAKEICGQCEWVPECYLCGDEITPEDYLPEDKSMHPLCRREADREPLD